MTRPGALPVLLCALLVSGCSLKQKAVSTLGSALAEGASVYQTDDDPDLVEAALPFALKTLEALLVQQPENRELLFAAAKGFTGYAFGFVQLEAERLAAEDYERSRELRRRATRLYLRARDYALRALEVDHPGIREQLQRSPREAVERLSQEEIATIYWTAAAWGAAISTGKDRPELLADLGAVVALLERGLALDPTWGDGLFHEAMISVEALPAMFGGDLAAAKEHFERAIELSQGRRAGPFVTYAEKIAVQTQDRPAYVDMLERALAIDPDAHPPERLTNLLLQEKARWMLERTDDYFLADDPNPSDEGAT